MAVVAKTLSEPEVLETSLATSYAHANKTKFPNDAKKCGCFNCNVYIGIVLVHLSLTHNHGVPVTRTMATPSSSI